LSLDLPARVDGHVRRAVDYDGLATKGAPRDEGADAILGSSPGCGRRVLSRRFIVISLL
jgi:hypothetical protein